MRSPFDDVAFDEADLFDFRDLDATEAAEVIAAQADAPPAEEPLPRIDPSSGGIAYITVTDASGRVLFRRPASPDEVTEALRSADEAYREGEDVMNRIALSRMLTGH